MGANGGIRRGSSSGAPTIEDSESESAGVLNEEFSSTSLSSCNANETSSEKTAPGWDDSRGAGSATVWSVTVSTFPIFD